ncbi:efflux RND transporter permease subunit [Pontibacter sp. G13]|uniref:efflux RND transporter permease subunit n=1 Tax=Pontibacter sp. G13 TaxID=3074898 RepID=UPI00288BA268|nr:efflux RND transporter permease subunit [Pontibacter sp. G13]WNJ19899.1 efflux RND transporter permease subunit [Pontibacter sp. G13]
MSIVKSALDHRQIVLLFAALLLAYGTFALLTMPRREDPKFNIREGLIVAAYPGASNVEIEQQVTTQIEELLFSFEEVRKDKTYSNSRQGVLYIVVELQSYVTNPDPFWAKLQHALNTLKLTQLPPGVIGPVVQSDFGDTIALLMAFQSKERDSRELRQYVNQFNDRLRQLEALSKIRVLESQAECFYLYLDNRKLSQYRVYLPQILAALRRDNQISPGGSIEIGPLEAQIINPHPFQTRQDIEDQIIAVDPTGSVLRVKDLGSVERGYQDPQQHIRVNGYESVLVSVEMQNGFNIVDFGKEVDAVLDAFKTGIPADIEIHKVVDQPLNVSESVNDFIREFFIAIVAVIVVIILLLPFRVALIATTAIPITVAFTFAVLDAVGIQLQQVSLASLIVVLGMLVDDAIVIADNYVEKLDEGMDRYQAAWKSAEELKIPMLTAGLTIAGAFAPLLLMSGYVGEFIQSLPLTVAIAINASFIVAMFLTPFLCYEFIRKGLNTPSDSKKSSSNSPLNLLQQSFDWALEKGFKAPWVVYLLGVISIAAGVGCFFLIPQKLFPQAERNQFVIELRAREGTSLAAMDSLTRQVEQSIEGDERLVSYATFVGTSSPRFYYNYAQQFPQTNIGQLLINTHSHEETKEWVKSLSGNLQNQHPELELIVKEMVQGPTIAAPVEFRISGEDLATLERLGDSVAKILRTSDLASHVQSDFRNRQLAIDIDPRRVAANRLGISEATITQELAIAYTGLPIGTIWEAKTPLSVILKDQHAKEGTVEEMEQFYLTSPLTGASIPLKEVAEIQPIWTRSNLFHRNGVRTLSILSQVKLGGLPSELVEEVRSRILQIPLPPGYQITVGGEDETQRETFEEMYRVVVFSVFIIFLLILLQFKQLNKVLIVLAAIPLCIFGATFGLWISGYPFGFTAFVGVASLIGVSVRNSIILVDHADELVRDKGMNIREAGLAAGKRRIRPIFLTTMAAAVGVTPMIISGSPMWAPLATVLAIGLIFSMIMTLLTIPLLYAQFGQGPKPLSGQTGKVTMITFLLIGFSLGTLQAQTIPLEACIDIAKDQNPQLELLSMEIQRQELAVKQVRSESYPKVLLDGGVFWYYNTERTTEVEISINELPAIGGIPPIGLGTEFLVPEGNRFIGVANLGIYQPITQLFKIHSGASVQETERDLLQQKYRTIEQEIRSGIVKLYVGMSISGIKLTQYDDQIELIEEQLRQATEAVEAGQALDVALVGLKADRLDHLTKRQQAAIDQQNYRMQLNKLLEFPLDSLWESTDIRLDSVEMGALMDWSAQDSAFQMSDPVQSANLTLQKAEYGHKYYRQQHIPDVTLTAQGFYLENLPLIPQFNGFVGATLSWPILQWGKKRYDVERAELQVQQAQLQLNDAQKDAQRQIEIQRAQLLQARELVNTAQQALEFRTEARRIKEDAFRNGLISYQDFSDSQQEQLDAQTQLMEAKANMLIQTYQLRQLVGL